MLGKLLPLLFLLVGGGVGMGAAVFMMPQPDPGALEEAAEHGGTAGTADHGDAAGQQASDHGATAHSASDDSAGHSDFVKLNNQFVVPVLTKDRVSALVVLSLTLETEPNLRETIFQQEPKLRDAFLQVLFDHANMGGFSGTFTSPDTMTLLRNALRDVAQKELGTGVTNVLVESIARQDVQS